MTDKIRRTQKERSQTTQKKLIEVSRELFGRKGYANTSIEDVVQEADVTRGALYHHYPGKESLFRAVSDEIEVELMDDMLKIDLQRLGWKSIHYGLAIFLDRCLEQDFRQIVLLDGPTVLGLERWHDMERRVGGAQLKYAIARFSGNDEDSQMRATMITNVFIGGLIEAAKSISTAEDPQLARKMAGDIIDRLLEIFQPPE